MKFFLILKGDGGWFFSPFAEVDKPGEMGEVLQPALPLSVLERLLPQDSQLGNQKHILSCEELKRMAMKALRRETGSLSPDWNRPEIRDSSGTKECPPEFVQAVRGRQLTDRDLGWLAKEMRVQEDLLWRWADALVRRGGGEWLPAVRKIRSHWQCQRCGGEDVEEWPSVFGTAATCKSCSSLGPATSLGVLFRSRCLDAEMLPNGITGNNDSRNTNAIDGNSVDTNPVNASPANTKTVNARSINKNCSFKPQFALTPAQERAAADLLDFVKDPLASEILVWAACGAGKTEVGFPAIDWALRHGLSVLFAAPRQDVVSDVAPRLERDFPGLAVPLLTGRTPGILRGSLTSGLVLATTHQVLRFYQAFDLIILDEMDAFPYAGSRALSWGLVQALRPGGKLITMTATPTERQLKSLEINGGKVIRLPARHHRHPLPVPVWEKVNFREAQEWLPDREAVQLWAKLKSLRAQGPVLLFVPQVVLVKTWVERLRQGMPQFTVLGSFSSDPERQTKVAKLRAGKVDFFVSTSILERGVTIEGIQVVVVAADHPVFDERSLVQMAGRAGRSPRRTEGLVLFWSKRKTAGIEKAIQWIKDQNALAKAQGLIMSEGE